MLNPGIPKNYNALCVKKWQGLLEKSDVFGEITNPDILKSTAVMLENTMADFERKIPKKLIVEATSAGMGSGGVFGTADGYNTDGGNADARMPSIVIPAIRRAFPNLIAHEIVGVQPMNGPVGFAFALRALYGRGNGTIPTGSELGYNYVDVAHSGASGANSLTGTALEAWQSFAGVASGLPVSAPDSVTQPGPDVYSPDGTGADTADSEWWNFTSNMPMVSFKMLKTTITAKTRKLGANWSMELEEDMAAQQGIDVRGEFVNITSYEVQQAIDRQILAEIIKSALVLSNVSSWTPVTADGRNQQERIGTLYTEMIRRANDVAIKCRRGAANFCFASPNVCSLFAATAFNPLSMVGLKADEKGLLTQNGVAKVGTFVNGGITLYRDTLAMGNYMVLGFKGQTSYDSGIIYCPYIPLQLKEVIGTDDLNPRMMIRTRYGITQNLLAAGNYYHMIKVDGLNSILVNDNGTVGDTGRIFQA